MSGYLKRLISALGAYQLADLVGKLMGVLLLPIYTGYIQPAGYGTVEAFATAVIFASIVVRLGMIEAFLRYHFAAADAARRDALARRAVGFLLATTTAVAIPLACLAGPLSRALLARRDPVAFELAVLGLWAFTNLELAYGLLRVEERLRAYALASLSNVALTIGGSLALVVGLGAGADGLMGASYGATAVVLVGVWWALRDRLLAARAPAERLLVLLRFGLPTVPAEASVYALSVVDRIYIIHARSLALAGLYSIAIKFAGAIALLVRAFQYAWPPLAYSIADDREAGALYGLITTYYVLVAGWIVALLALLGRFILRLLVHAGYYGADAALPWLALGWALYGMWVIFLVIAGRAKATGRNFVAALAGLAVNVALLVVLVGPFGIAGAGIALCGAYVAMLGVMYALTQRVFAVRFEWRRLAHAVLVLGALAGGGDALAPARGPEGLLVRLGLWLAIPALLHVTGFAHERERQAVRALFARARSAARASRVQRGAMPGEAVASLEPEGGVQPPASRRMAR